MHDIYLSETGFIKICDPTAATSSPYEITSGYFYSPEILRSINGGTNEEVNIFKSDTFALGCCILELSLMKNIADIFSYEDGLLDKNTLSKYIEEFRELGYSKEYTEFVEETLILNFRSRPDFTMIKTRIFEMFNLTPGEHSLE